MNKMKGFCPHCGKTASEAELINNNEEITCNNCKTTWRLTPVEDHQNSDRPTFKAHIESAIKSAVTTGAEAAVEHAVEEALEKLALKAVEKVASEAVGKALLQSVDNNIISKELSKFTQSDKIADKYANPAPIGLLGFGMTTVLLNLHNAEIFPMSVVIIAMGIFYGGIAQILAGLLEFKKGNTFGLAAFVSYGFFWLTLVFILIAPEFKWTAAAAASRASVGCYLLLWGIFTLFMFIGTLKSNFVLKFIFGSLTVLFFLLALAHAPIVDSVTKPLTIFAGYEGIICGASAIYLGLAEILNEKLGRVVLPIG